MGRSRIGVLLIVLPLVVLLAPVAFARRLLIRMAGRPRLSIWTGAPIITLAINARAERLLGVDARSLVLSTYVITSQFDIVISRSIRHWRLQRLAAWAAFVWICIRADRVHAYCDGGILPSSRHLTFNSIEMEVYRLLRIPVFLWTYGADVRTRQTTVSLGEPNCCSECPQVGRACICSDVDWEKNYTWLRQRAKAVLSMGDMIEYTPGSRNDLFFWPIDFGADEGARYRPVFPEAHTAKPLRIVHAPNQPEFKGTRFLQAAVEALRREGVPVELVLVQRVPNNEALAIYRTADVVFDQCLIGFHGYFALEAMALGKPVMCFIRDPERYLLKAEACPILNVHRDGIKDALRRFALEDRSWLPEIGRQSRAYVEENFSVEAFSKRLSRCYDDLNIDV